jgi:hypothetical protein
MRDDDRDHGQIERERGLDFHPDEIAWVFQPRRPVFVGNRNPGRADDHQDCVGARQRLSQEFREGDPDRDGVDVAEDRLRAEAFDQPIIDPAGRLHAVGPPVGQEDGRHPPDSARRV